jgi:hypothetical protein
MAALKGQQTRFYTNHFPHVPLDTEEALVIIREWVGENASRWYMYHSASPGRTALGKNKDWSYGELLQAIADVRIEVVPGAYNLYIDAAVWEWEGLDTNRLWTLENHDNFMQYVELSSGVRAYANA